MKNDAKNFAEVHINDSFHSTSSAVRAFSYFIDTESYKLKQDHLNNH